ncbi:hypothetical protein Tco_1009109 [Tanacetum coccineum]
MNEDYYHEQNFCYNSNSFGFDQFLPQQLPVIDQNPLEESTKNLRIAFQAWSESIRQKKEEEEKRIAEEQAAKARYWKIPICYDDDDDEESSISLRDIIISGLPLCITITPILSTEEPVNSLIMEDEHLDTIPATESDEVIKSNVEDLVPIPSESEGIPDTMCDVPFCDNTTSLEAFKEHSEIVVDSNDDDSSSDDDSPYSEGINYVDASPPDSELVSLEVVEIVIPEVGGINTDILITIKDDILHEKLLNVNLFIAKIEALKDNPTSSPDFVTKSSSTSLNFFLEETNTFDNSLPESETFCFNLEEISSGSPTSYSDLSLPDYEAFFRDSERGISLWMCNSLGSDLVVSFPLETRNKIFDPEIFIGIQSKIFLSWDAFSISFIRDPLFPVIDTLLPFSSENENNVVNTGILAAGEEQSPYLSSHRGLNALNESPMMISGGDTPILDVSIARIFKASRAPGFVLQSLKLQILSFILGI